MLTLKEILKNSFRYFKNKIDFIKKMKCEPRVNCSNLIALIVESCDREMGLKLIPSNVIGNPNISASSNNNNIHLVKMSFHSDGSLPSAWVPDSDDTEKFVQVDFDEFVTITGMLIRGGLTANGTEGHVTSVSFKYKDGDEWRAAETSDTRVPVDRSGSSTEPHFIALHNVASTRVSGCIDPLCCYFLNQTTFRACVYTF